MKTGLLKKGFLSIALAIALLVSLMPLTALADDPGQPEGDSGYTFTLTGYGYGRAVGGVSVACEGLTGGDIGSPTIYEVYDESKSASKQTTDERFNAKKQYYLSVKFSIDASFSVLEDKVVLMFDGQPCDTQYVERHGDEAKATAVFELPLLDATPFPVPFEKIFVQTGGIAPAEGSFELEVLNSDFESLGSDFTVKGLSFATEGSHSFGIENNDFNEVLALLGSGIYVSEKNLEAEGWSYDDAVWYVRLGPDPAGLTDDSRSASSPFDDYLNRLEFYKGKMVDDEFVPDSQDGAYLVPADKMVFTNSYNETDPVVSLTLPLVKKVTQGGAMTPGKETFKFEIFDIGNSDAESYADVTYTAAVETNGKGDFEGELTITGSASQVESFICEGFFVREVKGTAEGWTCSDAVWFVNREWIEAEDSGYTFTPILGGEASNGNPDGEVEPQMVLVVYPATCEVDELGEKHYVPAEESVAKMSFENVYTAAAPATLAKTGDNTNAGLLVTALFISGLVVTGAVHGARRRLAE